MNKLSKTALPSIHVQGHLDGEEVVGDPGQAELVSVLHEPRTLPRPGSPAPPQLLQY